MSRGVYVGIAKIIWIICSIITQVTNNVGSWIISQQDRTPINDRPRLGSDLIDVITCGEIRRLVWDRSSKVRRLETFKNCSAASYNDIQPNILLASASEEYFFVIWDTKIAIACVAVEVPIALNNASSKSNYDSR